MSPALRTTCARSRATAIGATLDKWGWAVDAGVSFNIPNFAGSVIGLTGAWSQNAIVVLRSAGRHVGRDGRGQRQRPGDGARRRVLQRQRQLGDADGLVGHRLGAVHGQPAGHPRRRRFLRRNQWTGTTASRCCRTRRASWSAASLTTTPSRTSTSRSSCSTRTPRRPADRLRPGAGCRRTTAAGSGKSDGFAARFEVTRSF